MKGVLIFGEGYIGTKLQKFLNCEITDKHIKQYSDIQDEIDRYKPKIIINAIGYTGYPNVDECENNIDKTMHANVCIPALLAEAVARNNVRLVHISSGCIFEFDHSQDKPIEEKKEPDYMSLFYSRSKIYSEKILTIKGLEKNILVLRIRIPLDCRSNPKNVLNKLIKYKKIIDIPNSVTYIPDFLKATKHLIAIKAFGIYNVVNKGGLRYPQLLDVYRKHRPDFNYEIVNLKKILKTPRTNLVLSTKKLESTGFKVRKVNEILEECVAKFCKEVK